MDRKPEHDLKVDKEFFSYLPQPTAEEYARFEEMIREEGIRDPLCVWKGKDIVVDGMKRYAIAVQHGLPFKVHEIEFENRADVKLWISRNQATRRNLTKDQLAYHLGVVYNSAKGEHGGPRATNDEAAADAPESAEDKKTQSTAERVAAEAGATPSQVKTAGKFASLVDAASEIVPEIRDAINAGKKIGKKALKSIIDAPNKTEAKRIAKEAIEGKPKAPKASGKKAEKKQDKTDPKHEEEKITILDGLGNPVKDSRFHEVFSDMEEFDVLLRNAKALQTGMRRLSEAAGGCNIHFQGPVEAAFKLILAELRDKKPMRICPKCKGEKTIEKDGKRIECDPCLAQGFVDKFHHQQKR